MFTARYELSVHIQFPYMSVFRLPMPPHIQYTPGVLSMLPHIQYTPGALSMYRKHQLLRPDRHFPRNTAVQEAAATSHHIPNAVTYKPTANHLPSLHTIKRWHSKQSDLENLFTFLVYITILSHRLSSRMDHKPTTLLTTEPSSPAPVTGTVPSTALLR